MGGREGAGVGDEPWVGWWIRVGGGCVAAAVVVVAAAAVAVLVKGSPSSPAAGVVLQPAPTRRHAMQVGHVGRISRHEYAQSLEEELS